MERVRLLLAVQIWSLLYTALIIAAYTVGDLGTVYGLIVCTGVMVLGMAAIWRHQVRGPAWNMVQRDDALWRYLTAPPAPTPDYRSAAEIGHQKWLDKRGLYEVK